MIRDLDEASGPELEGYDLCVIGSGPAGGTLINELRDAGLRICVLESGRRKRSRYADELRRVESGGIQIKENSRERVLGGASTTWSGLSSPMDPVDLADRPYLQVPGWPITEEELAADYRSAAERYRFPPIEAFEQGGFDALREEGDLRPRWEELDEKIFLAADEPQNFGREWTEIYKGEDVDLWLDSSVIELLSSSDAAQDFPASIEAALVRTRSGKDVRVSAKRFVVAAGGLENARLLLLSKIATDNDQVGRYLMNHPKNYNGILHLDRSVDDLPYFFGCLKEGFAGYAGLRLPLHIQREQQLMNCYVRLEPLFPWSDNDGVTSLVLLVKQSHALFSGWKKRHAEEVVVLRDYAETGDDTDLADESRSVGGLFGLALRVLLHLPSVFSYLYYRLSRAQPPIKRVRIRNFMEMEPRPENRVTLDTQQDSNGVAIANIQHECSELDKRSLRTLHEALARDFQAAGLGRFVSTLDAEAKWPIDQDASHHMGTTRMGLDPKTSVVDADLRVHGISNLYMAGASVFPTSGCVNPTFTIVALSIRLARHLRGQAGADTASVS
ncbi:MAG: hypothetical protein ACI835_005601 [Planctomycetota bacterium]|jgi:hypothetical protein